MIRTVTIRGFKSIQEASIDLGRINCFIGANGVGKSNVLEALGVLGAAANGVVDDESLLRRGVRLGPPRLYKSSFEASTTPPHIFVGAVGERAEEYRVALLNPRSSPEPAWSYKTEFLKDALGEVVSDGVRNKKNLNPQAGLAALSVVELAPDRDAARLMECLKQYAIYCPNTPSLRGLVPDQQSRTPVGLSGGGLADGFQLLQQSLSASEDGEEVLDGVLELIDWVYKVEATSHGASLVSSKVPRTKQMLKFTDRFMAKSRNELTAYDASEGALYILFCAVLCLSSQSPKTFAVDNIDQALNPRLLTRLAARLAGWLMRADPERQMLFTAHNPAVLDGLQLEDPEVRLFAVERNSDGMTVFRRITLSPELQTLNEQYPLSRLWMMGHLGAVPNV
jgi:hypothetical protein